MKKNPRVILKLCRLTCCGRMKWPRNKKQRCVMNWGSGGDDKKTKGQEQEITPCQGPETGVKNDDWGRGKNQKSWKKRVLHQRHSLGRGEKKTKIGTSN